jgi:glycosyltransferase involved in cell wall biosynthesis
VLQALQLLGPVEVVVLDEGGRDQPVRPETNGDFKVAYNLRVTSRPPKGFAGKVRWTFDPRVSYPHGCGVGDEGLRRVVGGLGEFDLVWFFKLRAPNLFPNVSWPRSVVDIDDVPSTFERATAQHGSSIRERLLARVRQFSWRRRERLLGKRFSVLTVCSEGDRDYLKRLGVAAPVHVVPNGFEKPAAEPVHRPAKPPRIGFIGLFSYAPNREGIQWFIDRCWPRIKRAVPDARLRLVGEGSQQVRPPGASDVDALGWVADADAEMATWSAMAVPIWTGAGTRVKIAQAFGQKCPVVSTSLGAYGYDAVDGNELYLADSAEAFADACVRTMREPEQAAEMAGRGWRQFLEKWTWDAIRPHIHAAAEDCLRQNAGTTATPADSDAVLAGH